MGGKSARSQQREAGQAAEAMELLAVEPLQAPQQGLGADEQRGSTLPILEALTKVQVTRLLGP